MTLQVKTTSEVLGIVDFSESPHQINKKAYYLKLLFDKRLAQSVPVTHRF